MIFWSDFLDLHKLKYFVQVVESGSISQAAKALNMTQPPLSILINRFEEEMQVTLFQRYKKRLVLTETGRLLYERGVELLSKTEDIKLELKEQGEGLRGTVRVGCITSANLFLIPSVVQDIISESPNVVTRVKEGDSSYILSELRNGELDLGIVRTTFQAEDLQTTTLLTEPLLLALPPDHYLTEKKAISLLDLKDENFILPNTTFGYGISDHIIESCQAEGFTPNIVYWGTETLPMLQMVSKGVGISFAPKMYKALNGVEAHLVELKAPELTTKLVLVTMKNRYRTPVVNRFMGNTIEIANLWP